MPIKIVRRKSATVLRKGNGDELPVAVPKRISVPQKPLHDRENPDVEERERHDEQQVVRVAYLMAKGVRERPQLMKLLEITDYRLIDRYISRAEAQWEMLGAMVNVSRARGEGLLRLDMVENKLWDEVERNQGFAVTDQETGKVYKVEGDSRATIVALDKILEVQKHRDLLNGVTPKTIERIGTPAAESTEFTIRTEAHDRVSRVAQLLIDRLNSRKTIDATSST